MTPEEYRAKAVELDAKARLELDPFARVEFERLADSYRRLAAQAERNRYTDIVMEPAPLSGRSEQAIQQQQQQAQSKKDE